MSAAEAAPRVALIAAFLVAFGIGLQLQPVPVTPAGFPQPFRLPVPGGLLTIAVGVLVGVLALLLWRRAELQRARFKRTGFTLNDLRGLSPEQFEEWCADRLHEQGFTVTVVGGQGDHGIDLIAERDGVRTDLLGAMQHEGAASGMVLTTGQFSPAARTWAQGKSISLWGPEELLAGSPPTSLRVTTLTAPSTQACPSCGHDLVRRINRNTQMPFWGCSGYPTCRFTRPIAP